LGAAIRSGRSHLVTTEARVSICCPLRGDEEREQACCRLLTELSAYPEHKAAVRQYLIGRP
jgi:hypothetical protein